MQMRPSSTHQHLIYFPVNYKLIDVFNKMHCERKHNKKSILLRVAGLIGHGVRLKNQNH